MSQQTYPFVTAMMDRRRLTPSCFPACFDQELVAYGFARRDGEILRDDKLTGLIGYLSLAEAAAAFPGAAWVQAPPACPWLGEVMGFVTWMLFDPQTDDPFLDVIERGARGRTVHVPSGEQRDAVVLRRHGLGALLERHGFHDGDLFLDRERDDPAYATDCVARVNAVLSAAGLEPDADFVDTHHNPLVYGAAPVRPSALAGLSAELWTYDPTLARDHAFWQR